MIIYIILEAHAWYSICIATYNDCQTDIVGGFGCNENNCTGMDKNQNQWRPSLSPPLPPPPLGINIQHHLGISDDMNLSIEMMPCTQDVCHCN
jgi:hypothetical protein